MPQDESKPVTISYATPRKVRRHRAFHVLSAIVAMLSFSVIHFGAFLISGFLGYAGGRGSVAYMIAHVLGFPALYVNSLLDTGELDSLVGWLVVLGSSLMWGAVAGVTFGFMQSQSSDSLA